MDFKTMAKQRKFILIAAAVGVISMFLPWFSVSMLGMSQSVNGMHGWGVLGFFCFVIAGLVALYGNQKTNLDKTMWMLSMILGLVPLLIVIFTYTDASGSFMGTEFIGFGMYLSGIAAIAVIASAWLFKSPTDNLKDGFDTLKKSVENKLGNAGDSSQAPPPPPPSSDTSHS